MNRKKDNEKNIKKKLYASIDWFDHGGTGEE